MVLSDWTFIRVVGRRALWGWRRGQGSRGRRFRCPPETAVFDVVVVEVLYELDDVPVHNVGVDAVGAVRVGEGPAVDAMFWTF